MSGVALLDVNVLVALFDPDHVHHDAAHAWFAANRAGGWATCDVASRGSRRGPVRDRRAPELLCASGGHFFWPDSVSLRDRRLFHWSAGVGHDQITDIYLLGLARQKGGRLATFDRRIPAAAVVGAEHGHVEVIPA